MAKTFEVKKKGLTDALENGFSEPASPPAPTRSVSSMVEENLKTNLSYYTVDNAPENYEDLKKEVHALAYVHAHAFLILAHRLKIIRDRDLYKQDGYKDFTEFIENELEIARRTVYNYIQTFEEFGVQHVARVENIKLRNLFHAIPYSKKHPKEKETIFQASQSMLWGQFRKFLSDNYSETKEVKTLDAPITEDWSATFEELIYNSKVIRDGMKKNTIKRDARDYINWLLIDDPKNKALQKMKDLWTDL